MAVNIDIIHYKYDGIYVGMYALTFLKKLLLPYSEYTGPSETLAPL
jgi:hypothetical protein